MQKREVTVIAQAAAMRLYQGIPITDLLELFPWLSNVVDAGGRTLLHIAYHYGRMDAIRDLQKLAGITKHSWL